MIEDVDIQRPNNEPKPGGITGKGFVKGDKRINRKGRPRSFDALRKLAQQVAALELPEGEGLTRIEAMLRVMSTSRNPADRALFLAYAYGKPKDEIEHSGEMVQKVIIEYSDDQTTEAAPEAIASQAGTAEV
jgi:hypothetical protein